MGRRRKRRAPSFNAEETGLDAAYGWPPLPVALSALAKTYRLRFIPAIQVNYSADAYVPKWPKRNGRCRKRRARFSLLRILR